MEHEHGGDATVASVDAVHVAQLNIGTMVAPTDDPAVAEFMDSLDRINALADEAPGFVWRLQTESGNATGIHIFPDPLQLVNMSVWESVETLKHYVYRSEHVDFFRRRAAWFEPSGRRLALWWVPAGTTPELDDAVRRIEFLERYGPSPYAFGFATAPAARLVFDTTVPGDVTARLDGAIAARASIRPTGDDLAAIETPDLTTRSDARLLEAALLDQLELMASRAGLVPSTHGEAADRTTRPA